VITGEDRAWAAGVVDVLGSFKIRETESGAVLPALYVSTPKFQIAEQLGRMTGVGITTVSRNYKRTGCGEHCNEAHLHVESTTARWSLTGARCTVFLSGVLPFLMVQASEAERFVQAGLEAKHKPATLTKMYDLGWPKVKFGVSS